MTFKMGLWRRCRERWLSPITQSLITPKPTLPNLLYLENVIFLICYIRKILVSKFVVFGAGLFYIIFVVLGGWGVLVRFMFSCFISNCFISKVFISHFFMLRCFIWRCFMLRCFMLDLFMLGCPILSCFILKHPTSIHIIL